MKEQKRLTTKLKRSNAKGITLIALVITVIVLLILAGVSINGILGQGSVVNQAKEAKTQTNNKQEEESISVAMAEALQKGDLSKEVIEEELDGLINGEVVGEEGCCSWIVEGKSENNYIITGNGEVTLLGSTVTAQDLNKLIGRTVEGYDAGKNEGGVEGWRVFYASEENNEVFLISKNVVSTNTAIGSSNGIPLKKDTSIEYTGAEDVFASDYGKRYNAMWKTVLGSSPNTNNNAKATAYLCDPNKWDTKYKTGPATYAVGGPTKELLVLSWNQAYKNGGTNAPREKVILGDNDVVADGYIYNKPDALYSSGTSGPIKSEILDGLYKDGETSYWLASPGTPVNNRVCMVNIYGSTTSWSYSNTEISIGVRPLVSIPISNVQIVEGEVTIAGN